MEKNLERKVGIFVSVGTVVLLSIIFMIGGDKAFFRSFQKMKIRLDETSGLNVGNVVQIAGVPVGNVTGIEFDVNSTKLLVDLKIDKRFAPKITKGSVAAIRTQGALGDKFVMIMPGPADATILTEKDIIPSEENSDLLSTLGKSGSKVEKVFEILDRVNRIVTDMENGKFGKNLADSSRALKGTMQSMDDALAGNKLKSAMHHLNNIMEKIDKGQGTLGALINDPTVHEDIKALLGGAKRSALLKYLIRQTVQKNEDEAPEKKK